MLKKTVSSFLLFVFCLTSVAGPDGRVFGQTAVVLPVPGTCISLTPTFHPMILKGIKVYAKEPFRFDFILDKGDKAAGRDESLRLVKYFLGALTVPEKDLWVNLSPYEKDRIVPDAFGQTEMGRDLLAQDYILKMITASLMYPEEGVGKKFWAEIYRQAQARFGTTDIPLDTFNKVWIIPASAVVYEKPRRTTDNHPQEAVAYVVESRLKVMLESDYLAAKNITAPPLSPSLWGRNGTGADLAKALIRDIILPVLEKEVNEGQNFAQLRQVYNSIVLAAWYKKKVVGVLRQSPLDFYIDQNKITGVNTNDPKESEKIWARYVESFRKGVYNYIRDEYDPTTKETIPRKYFAGGAVFSSLDLGMAASMDASQIDTAGLVDLKVRMRGVLPDVMMDQERAIKIAGHMKILGHEMDFKTGSWDEALNEFGKKFPGLQVEFRKALFNDALLVMLNRKVVAKDEILDQPLNPDGRNELVIIKKIMASSVKIARISNVPAISVGSTLMKLLSCKHVDGTPLFTVQQALMAVRHVKGDPNAMAHIIWLVRKKIFRDEEIYTLLTQGRLTQAEELILALEKEHIVLSGRDGRVLMKFSLLKGDISSGIVQQAALDVTENIEQQVAQSGTQKIPLDIDLEGVSVQAKDGGVVKTAQDFLQELQSTANNKVLFAELLLHMRFEGQEVFTRATAMRLAHLSDRFDRFLFFIELIQHKTRNGSRVFGLKEARIIVTAMKPGGQAVVRQELNWLLNILRDDGYPFFSDYWIDKILLTMHKNMKVRHELVDYFIAQKMNDRAIFGPGDIIFMLEKSRKIPASDHLIKKWEKLWGRLQKKNISPQLLLQMILDPRELRKHFSRLMAGIQENVDLGRSDESLLFKYRLLLRTTMDVDDVAFLLYELLPSEAEKLVTYMRSSVNEDARLAEEINWGNNIEVDLQSNLALRMSAMSFSYSQRKQTLDAVERWMNTLNLAMYWRYLEGGGKPFIGYFLDHYLWSRMNAGKNNLISEFYAIQLNIKAYSFWADINDDELLSAARSMLSWQKQGLAFEDIEQKMLKYHLASDIRAAREYLKNERRLNRPLGTKDSRELPSADITSRDPGHELAVIEPALGNVVARTVTEALTQYFSDKEHGELGSWIMDRWSSVNITVDGKTCDITRDGPVALSSGKHTLDIYYESFEDDTPRAIIHLTIDAVATGGIDLASSMQGVESRGDSTGATFQFDVAALHQMDGAKGLDPVIISMEPLISVVEFFSGVKI